MKAYKIAYQTVGGHWHNEKRKSISIWAASEVDAECKFSDTIAPLITEPGSDMAKIFSIEITEV